MILVPTWIAILVFVSICTRTAPDSINRGLLFFVFFACGVAILLLVNVLVQILSFVGIGISSERSADGMKTLVHSVVAKVTRFDCCGVAKDISCVYCVSLNRGMVVIQRNGPSEKN